MNYLLKKLRKLWKGLLVLLGLRKKRKEPPMWQHAEEFLRRYPATKDKTLVSIDRCFMLWQLARHAATLPGDFAEIGVYQGGTAHLVAGACPGKTLHLFDTFGGMPVSDPSIDHHVAGDFDDTSLESVQAYLSDCPNVVFHPGLFPETARGLEDLRFAYVYVDVDIYRSVRDCLEFFYPRMVPGGVLVLDDYEWPHCEGVKVALTEFMADKPEVPIITARYQCTVIRQP